MGFFDNVKNTFTETSQELTQKAKDTTEIYRLNNANKGKEKEIEKIMYQIGIAFYSNYREECTEKFPDFAKQVETLQCEIANNKEAIEKLSVEEVCANCGKRINPGNKFCIYCGTATEVKTETPVETSENICKSCGQPLEKGNLFCVHCGTKVENLGE